MMITEDFKIISSEDDRFNEGDLVQVHTWTNHNGVFIDNLTTAQSISCLSDEYTEWREITKYEEV